MTIAQGYSPSTDPRLLDGLITSIGTVVEFRFDDRAEKDPLGMEGFQLRDNKLIPIRVQQVNTNICVKEEAPQSSSRNS